VVLRLTVVQTDRQRAEPGKLAQWGQRRTAGTAAAFLLPQFFQLIDIELICGQLDVEMDQIRGVAHQLRQLLILFIIIWGNYCLFILLFYAIVLGIVSISCFGIQLFFSFFFLIRGFTNFFSSYQYEEFF
jgi:hypothetical protein